MINKVVEDFYNQSSESERLRYGLGPLEFERNKELIERHIHKPRSVILDIGGGPGIYAEWLAKKGHDVYLADPVEKHIEMATTKASKLKKPFKTCLAAAGDLPFEKGMADLIILHGPLYHIRDKDERLKVLREARELLKPGGMVLAYAISYTASTLVGLVSGNLQDAEIYKMAREELTTHLHNAPESLPGVLAEAYYHSPGELKEEIVTAGLQYINIYAVEGIIWLDSNYYESRADPSKKNKMMELLCLTESHEDLIAISPHFMVAGRRH